MEGAKAIIDAKVAAGEWSKRNLGWFRIDLDKYPALHPNDNGNPDQMITGQGWRRMIGFENQYEEAEKNEEFFASIVRELTGDWVTKIECGMIQHKNRRTPDEVIYFGPESDLEKGGDAELVTQLSVMDRYNFNEQRASFGVNDSPDCRKQFDLDENKRFIAFLSENEAIPNIMTIGEDEISLNSLNFALTTTIVKATPRWGQRAFSAFFDWKQNGIIYYMPDVTKEDLSNDWRVTLMISIKEWIQ